MRTAQNIYTSTVTPLPAGRGVTGDPPPKIASSKQGPWVPQRGQQTPLRLMPFQVDFIVSQRITFQVDFNLSQREVSYRVTEVSNRVQNLPYSIQEVSYRVQLLRYSVFEDAHLVNHPNYGVC